MLRNFSNNIIVWTRVFLDHAVLFSNFHEINKQTVQYLTSILIAKIAKSDRDNTESWTK